MWKKKKYRATRNARGRMMCEHKWIREEYFDCEGILFYWEEVCGLCGKVREYDKSGETIE
jgi:hypothetical protein